VDQTARGIFANREGLKLAPLRESEHELAPEREVLDMVAGAVDRPDSRNW
jgi:hypothetical protein